MIKTSNIMKSIKTVFTILFIFSFSIAQAQIFGRIVDRVADKVVDKMEDKLVEKISDEIARAAYRPVEAAIDSMFRHEYEARYGASDSVDYSDFLNKILTPVDLPASYTFDVRVMGETKDYDGTKNDIEILMTKNGDFFGTSTYEDDGKSTVIIDNKNQIMAMYLESKNGSKSVTAFPSMMDVMTKYAVDQSAKDTVSNDFKFERTGKTKKIAGYQCDEWIMEDSATKTKAFIATDFPGDWKKSFGAMIKNISPSSRVQFFDGMVLKSETKTKKKGKKSTFVAKKVITNPTVITNADYTKEDYRGQE